MREALANGKFPSRKHALADEFVELLLCALCVPQRLCVKFARTLSDDFQCSAPLEQSNHNI
jgi:hypothetical protein